MPAALLLPLLSLGLLLTPLRTQESEELWAQGRRAEAIAALSRELESRPDDRELRRRLVARELEVHWYEAALDHMGPLGAEAGGERGVALYMLARYEEALALLDARVPRQALMRLEALEALARFEEAAAALEQAAAVLGADDARIRAARGRAWVRAGKPEDAIPHFRAALQSDALDMEALFGLGRALVATGAKDEGLALLAEHRRLTPLMDALDFAQRGLDLAPQHGPNHAGLGDAWRSLGRTDRARACYEMAAKLARGEEHVPIALRHARLLTEDLREVDAAVAVLEQAAAQHPDARLFVRAGDVLMDAQRPLEAVQRYWRARELLPGDKAIQARIERAQQSYRGQKDEQR